VARHDDLSKPNLNRGRRIELPRPNEDVVGRAAEKTARFFGTASYLIVQTFLVAVWIVFNTLAFTRQIHFDKYPFILLNLAFSTQAAYAAPLILLAQGRQEERDRQQVELDRETARRTQSDTEYLARELASIRIALADVATNDDLGRLGERVADLMAGGGKKSKKRKQDEGSDSIGDVAPGDEPGPGSGPSGAAATPVEPGGDPHATP
jgi:uncharacterized membrane protein